MVGEGGFADVFLGKYDGNDVAIKKLKLAVGPDVDPVEVLRLFSLCSSHCQISKGFREFRQEIAIMAGMNHPNVVNLLAVCMNPFCLVCEFVPCGTLYEFIHDYEVSSSSSFFQSHAQKPLPWVLRHKISVDLALGIQYMHSQNPPIVHIDMKTPNIMMMVSSSSSRPLTSLSSPLMSMHLSVPRSLTLERPDLSRVL